MVIHNLSLIESDKDKSQVRVLADRGELIAAIEQHFDMPPAIVSEALDGLVCTQDAWG